MDRGASDLKENRPAGTAKKQTLIFHFSSKSLDEHDIWTDSRLQRLPKID
jgi:hypothetical protein